MIKKAGKTWRLRGYRTERELVNTLWKLGFAVMRAPASGAKIRKADYPDIVAIRKGKVAVFEVKLRKDLTTIYIDGEQYRKLMSFSERAGGLAFIAIKVPKEGWRFVRADGLQKTKKGSYRVGKKQIAEGMTLKGVLTELGIIKDLSEYFNKQTNS